MRKEEEGKEDEMEKKKEKKEEEEEEKMFQSYKTKNTHQTGTLYGLLFEK